MVTTSIIIHPRSWCAWGLILPVVICVRLESRPQSHSCTVAVIFLGIVNGNENF
jgi:hypothetical protein